MKLVKFFNKLSAVALAASLVVGFASCSTTTDDPFNPNAPLTLEEYVKSEIKKAIDNGGAQAKPEDPSKPGKPSGSLKEPKSLEFHVNADSTNAENTMIFVKYDRSAYGAEEEVKVTDAELNLYINDAKVKTYNEIVFALDEYGDEITSRGPISDPKAMKEYKAKLSVGKAVKSGETVKIELVKASVVKVGAASDKITLANLQFALIDTDESVKYYKELAPNAEQFQNICTLEDLTTGEDTESKPEPTPTPGGEEKPGEKPEPTPDPKPEPGEEETPGEKPEPGKTPGEEYEAGNSTVTSIKLVKNEYAAGGALQTQIKIPSELTSLLVGDKVKVAFKGTADREIGNVELMIVDTTEDASYWTALSETKKDTFSTEINFDFEFEITKAPIGTGENSMILAINGLDSDEAATITCTSFSIEKNADKKPAGGENNAGGEGDNGAGESGAGKYTYTAIWTGEKVMEWSNFNLEHSYFDADVIGVRITYTVTGDGACFKPTVSEPWTDAAGSLDGETTITLTENSVENLGAVDTNGTVSVLFADGVIEKIVGEGHEGAWGGLTFQGQFVKFTKIETIK